MKPRLLIAEPEGFSEAALARLRGVAEVEPVAVPRGALGSFVHDVDVLWVRLNHRVDAALLERAPRLKVVATPVTGLDHLDLEACRRRGVQVVSLKGETEFLKTVRATAELTVGLSLALLRRLPQAAASVLQGEWKRDLFRGSELYGKTAGIVGVGRLGSIVAGYFQAFGMQVVGWDKRPDFPPGVRRAESLEALLAVSDLVSVHVSLDDSTTRLLGARQLAAMKRGAWLVNTSRGGVVDEAALLDALSSGRLAGAALDVLSGEPQIDAGHPLVAYARENPNVLIVPHVGGNTYESFEKTELFLAERVISALGAGRAQAEAAPVRRVLGIIPARGGSKRVPGKNLRKLGGKELVARSIEAALGASTLSTVVVSSDDGRVLEVAARYPGVVALQRPPEISTDTAPAIDYVLHALSTLEAGGQPPFDAVAIVQPSSPFTAARDIDATVQLLRKHATADSAVSVTEVDHAIHPFKLKRLEGDTLLPFIEEERGRMAAHELPKLWARNCSVYVTRRACLENKRSILGDESRGLPMPRERSVDINDELDWAFAEFLESKRAAQG